MKQSIRRLRCFLSLSETLNFRQAATGLGMSQPALSRTIVQLEAEVGTALFDRSRSHVQLTEAGVAFRDACIPAVAQLDRAARDAVRVARGELGELDIGYTDIAISGRLAMLVRGFRASAAGIEVSLLHAGTDRQIALLRSGELDVGFCTGSPEDGDLEGLQIQSDPLVAVVSADHPLASRRATTLDALADEPFVLGQEEAWRKFHQLLRGLCSKVGFRPRVIQRAPDAQGIVGLVACGMGVSVQAANLTVLDDPRVSVLALTDCDAAVDTYAVWTRASQRPTLRLFLSKIRTMIDENARIGESQHKYTQQDLRK